MIGVTQRDLTSSSLDELCVIDGVAPVVITNEQRDALAARFRSIPTDHHRRLDAWMVEKAGAQSNDFAWSPITARRVLGNAALHYVERSPHLSYSEAVYASLADQLDRAARGHARTGSLGQWIANLENPIVGIVVAEATTWATQIHQIMGRLGPEIGMASVDAYYDVAGARTTLRGRRDALIKSGENRIVVRFRSGLPGRTAGSGLRADLAVDALADPLGRVAQRIIGIWPEAGVALALDGTMETVRAGARDLVRSAIVEHRQYVRIAA
jgi:hypothetical protein